MRRLRRILAVPALAVMPVVGVISAAHPYGTGSSGVVHVLADNGVITNRD